jgi:hypothetical protein
MYNAGELNDILILYFFVLLYLALFLCIFLLQCVSFNQNLEQNKNKSDQHCLYQNEQTLILRIYDEQANLFLGPSVRRTTNPGLAIGNRNGIFNNKHG